MAAAALVAAVLTVALAVQLFSGSLKVLSAGGPSWRDPQFAEEPEKQTRPPELNEDGQPVGIEEDPSLGWVYEAQTPVDKTAEELSREAAAGE